MSFRAVYHSIQWSSSMSSSEYFGSYVELLNEEDLLNLFDIVRNGAGSLSKAAVECGIERKTIYDMMNEGKQARRKTKERILRAALKENTEKSIEIMLKKTINQTKEIYVSYLSLLYQKVMRVRSEAEFKNSASKFESIVELYTSSVLGNLPEDLASMTDEFIEKGTEFGISYNPPYPTVINVRTLAVKIPALIRDILTSPGIDPMVLAKKWSFDPSIALPTSQIIKEKVPGLFKCAGFGSGFDRPVKPIDWGQTLQEDWFNPRYEMSKFQMVEHVP